MALTIREIARALDAAAEGALDHVVARPAAPAEAGPEDLALAMDPRYLAELDAGAARAAVLPHGTDWRALGLEAAIFVGRPRFAMAGLTAAFAPPTPTAAGVHPAAVVAANAEIGDGATIGPLCVIEAGARIGAGARLIAQVFVGAGARVGPGCVLGAGVRLAPRVRVGAGSLLHPNAVIGADGFSFVTPEPGSVENAAAGGAVAEGARNTTLAKIHSLGAVTIGEDVEIGAGSAVDAGTVRDTRIGRGTKIDNLVQIGHNVTVGESCLICAQVGVAGSAAIGDRVVLGGQVGVVDHVRIGSDVVVGGQSAVVTHVPDRAVMLGSPALPRDETLKIVLAWRRLPGLTRTMRELHKRLSALEASR